MTKEKTPSMQVEEKTLSLDAIVVEENMNPRKGKDDDALKELTASVKASGILEPLLVRGSEAAEGKLVYTLIAGHRRLAAAKKAGLDQVPVRVFTVTDDEVDQIRAVENLHRKALNPIEEADSFQRLFARFPEAKTVAALVNKTTAYVHRALALLALPMEVQALIAGGELTAEHGHQIARTLDKVWPKLVKFVTTKNTWSNRYPTLDELTREIEKTVERDLKAAPFPKTEEYASMIACDVCPQNTGNQAVLFDGAEGGKCTGPACYAVKEARYFQDFQEKMSAKLGQHKFLGFTKDMGYGGRLELKGAPEGAVVLTDENLQDKAVKKAMEDNPLSFGWAIVKPGKHDERRKPVVAMVALDTAMLPKSAAPAKGEKPREAYDWKRDNFVRNVCDAALLSAAAKAFSPEGPKKDHLESLALRMMSHQDNGDVRARLGILYPGTKKSGFSVEKLDTDAKIEKFVRSMSKPELLHVVWVFSFVGNFSDEVADLGIDVKKIIKAASVGALAAWKEEKEKSSGKKKDVDAETGDEQ